MSSEVIVGFLWPGRTRLDGVDRDEMLARISAVDPRVVIVDEPYLRWGTPDPDAPPDETEQAAFAQIEVAFTLDLPLEVASYAPRLRWVQGIGAGTGQLQAAGLADAGIRLTSAAGVNAVSIAEFVIGRILYHYKQLRSYEELQRRREWGRGVFGRQLAGDTVALIGLGAINAAVAARLDAFDVHVLATRRSAGPGSTAPHVDELFPPSALHDVLARADVVVAAVPDTLETVGLMDAAAFAAMKPGALFVNVGRGSLVDEEALGVALGSGHLSGAALDVFSVEPLPAEHPIWDAPNLYLSPHAATAPAAHLVNLLDLFCDNLGRYLAGDELRNEVDLGRGY